MNGNIVFTNAWCFVLVTTSYVFSTTSVALLNYAGGTCSPFDVFFGHCIFVAVAVAVTQVNAVCV